MKQEITARQRRVFEFISEFIASNGYAPTVREIGFGLGISSPNGVCCHLDALVKKGWLKRDAERARAMTVIGDGKEDEAVRLLRKVLITAPLHRHEVCEEIDAYLKSLDGAVA